MTKNTERIRTALKQHFGYDAFRPGQEEVIEHLLAGQSAAAVFPTGGGKSLCYQLPALLLPGLTLVVSPLIALMKDQIDALSARGIAASRLDSSLSLDQYRTVMAQLRDGSLRLLYVAPERFNNERFRAAISRAQISLFAVDEAHCISEWGHNFRPDYLKLASFAEQIGAERVLALTATAPPAVLDDICQHFKIATEHAVRTGFYRPNLELLTVAPTREERDQVLLNTLQSQPAGPGIIYVTLQKSAEELAERLAAAGWPAKAYHAGLSDAERAAVQERFMRANDGLVVATIAFGMGIDKADIRYVYHYNPPKSLENYAQEIGRAGRDGKQSSCLLLFCPDDLNVLENFIYGDTPERASVAALLDTLFSQEELFAISQHELSHQHDIRLLVLRTLLTYLELDGLLEGGTPSYSSYRFKPLMSSKDILAQFDGPRQEFLAALFRQARKGRVWFSLDPAAAAEVLAVPRQRIVSALDWLAEQEMLEVQAAGVRHHYRRLRMPTDKTELVERLYQRLLRREEGEIARLRQVQELVESESCRSAMLAAHFGETLAKDCGHCSRCLGQPLTVLQRQSRAIPAGLTAKLEALLQDEAAVLATPRALTRFLCGVSSPGLSRAKLTAQPLFGVLAEHPFTTVLAWTTTLLENTPQQA